MLIFGKPALMGVPNAGIGGAGELDRSGFVGDIHNGEGVSVGSHANFVVGVGGIGAMVRHALGIVGVAIGTETTGKGYRC